MINYSFVLSVFFFIIFCTLVFARWHIGIVVVPFVKGFGLFSNFFREGFVCHPSGIGRGALASLTYYVSGGNRCERPIVVNGVRGVLFFRGLRQFRAAPSTGRMVCAIHYGLTRVATSHGFVRVFRVHSFHYVFRTIRVFFRAIYSRFPYGHRRHVQWDPYVFFFRAVHFYRVNGGLFLLVFLRLPRMETSSTYRRIHV